MLWLSLIFATFVYRLVRYNSLVESEMVVASSYIIHHRQGDKRPISAVARALETRCPKETVPPFVTFAVHYIPGGFHIWKDGRWGPDRIGKALRILYSSLSRTFNCAVELHVHTNLKRPISKLLQNDVYTTMGTMMNGMQFHPVNKTAWKNSPYLNPKLVPIPNNWMGLSRSKLETMESHLPKEGADGMLPVWVDLDTLVLDKVAVGHYIEQGRPWVYGYNRRNRTNCYGDMFSLDRSAIDDIRALENELIRNHQPLPQLDLQGYFGMLLDRNSSRFEIIQEHHNTTSFGFDCGGGQHPYPKNVQSKIKKRTEGGVQCKIYKNLKYGKVGSISFTAPSFRDFFLLGDLHSAFDIIEDVEARSWLSNFLFSSSTEID